MKEQFLISLDVKWDQVPDPKVFPFTLPAVRELHQIQFSPGVTFLIGENGSGKSTLLEAIAVALGINPEGGSAHLRFSTRDSHSALHQALKLVRGIRRPRDRFFVRAESFYGLATELDAYDLSAYGGSSLHELSHGEGFIALLNNRLGSQGLYLMDEPEAALSPSRLLACLRIFHQLVSAGSQLIIATHSPILLALPGAIIYQIADSGIKQVEYEETEHFRITRLFFEKRETMLKELLMEQEPD